jgi:hypothetical protein
MVEARWKLKRIVEQTDTPIGRAFDLAVQALIIVSLIGFAEARREAAAEIAARAAERQRGST